LSTEHRGEFRCQIDQAQGEQWLWDFGCHHRLG